MRSSTFSHSADAARARTGPNHARFLAAPGSSSSSVSTRRSATAGITIFEVMVAAIVMAFAITTSITTMQRAFVSLDTARNITIAGQIMQGEFERMRLLNWGTIAGYAEDDTTEMTIDTSFTSNAFVGNRFTLTRTADTIRTGMRKITLSISWKTYDGRTITRSYVSYYGENGLYDYYFNSL